MKKLFLLSLLLLIGSKSFTQNKFSKQEISINAFRNPSIGLEYRYKSVSIHGGYYITSFDPGITTKFIKVGATLWFLPVGHQENPSSFYAQLSYLRGLNREYEDKNGASVDVGFRWMVWQGLNLRIGVVALAAEGQSLKINPTPSIGYAFFF